MIRAVLLVAGLAAIVPAAAAGTNEREWKAALETQIRGGAPANDICIKAQSAAAVSNEAPFIEYALDVARRYCEPGKIGEKQPATPVQGPVVVNGRWIPVCSHGSLCLWHLREAMRQPVK